MNSKPRLFAVPDESDLVNIGLQLAIAEKFAEDVIDGKVIHNVETDVLVVADQASPDERAEAIAAYVRFMQRELG